jgi:hypothetical protein
MTKPADTAAGFIKGEKNSLTEFPALHSRATQQLAVLLLRHTLAALLDH